MSNPFISLELRKEMLRQLYFIIQLPVDEGREITFLCYYLISYIYNVPDWVIMNEISGGRVPKGNESPISDRFKSMA